MVWSADRGQRPGRGRRPLLEGAVRRVAIRDGRCRGPKDGSRSQTGRGQKPLLQGRRSPVVRSHSQRALNRGRTPLLHAVDDSSYNMPRGDRSYTPRGRRTGLWGTGRRTGAEEGECVTGIVVGASMVVTGADATVAPWDDVVDVGI